MGNMSYCRFTNTMYDLADCLEDMEVRLNNEGLSERGDRLSEEEFKSMKTLIQTAEEVFNIGNDVIDVILESQSNSKRKEMGYEEQ